MYKFKNSTKDKAKKVVGGISILLGVMGANIFIYMRFNLNKTPKIIEN